MDIESTIADLAAPGAEAAGLVVDGVSVKPAGNRTRVVVTVDLPDTEVGSADLDAVADASRAIGKALDEADVPSTPYVLEVSTPGTDRPLTEPRHFRRARSRLVDVVTADGAVTGRLTEVTDAGIVLDVDGTARTLTWDDVVSARIQVELKRLD